MKQYTKVVIMLAVGYVLAIALLAAIMGTTKLQRAVNDETVLKLNEITKTAEENWGDLSCFDGKDYGVDFVILSPTNEIRYDSGKTNATAEALSVQTAIKKGYPYAYPTDGREMLGYVILLDRNNSEYRNTWIRMIAGFSICGLLILVGAILFGAYIKRNIVTPFLRMEDFAGKVAEGKLDEPLIREKNNLFGVFTESFDIMREELQESRKRELALQKKERELVASLSHDLKTPITGIKVTTELLKAKAEQMDPSDQTADFMDKLDHIDQKTDQINTLVNDLFEVTLEDLGEFKVNCTDEEAKILGELIKKNDDRGLVKKAPVPDAIVRVDTKRMSQVLGNIISNSYKYAGTVIDADYRIVDGFLQMRLSDHGPGVPKEELELITNKFYRGKQWENSKEDGNGLGLYIARTLMEKMGGELIPESNAGGFSVCLLIPLS